ncbi:Uncharacterised protein [uncultured archaeon]|nr:Uncharacterised protein [uncultured archaeon]
MTRIEQWKKEIVTHKRAIAFSILFLIIAIILNFIASTYVSKIAGVSAPDLILDHIPTIDFDLIYIYGDILIVAVLFLYPLLFKVKELHKVINQFSLLILIRSFFITLTHLKNPSSALAFNIPSLLSFIFFQNDLFFSGHTAIPFLGFLLFKDSKIRYFFLFSSIMMAAVVLFMHVHYTIDVLSAFFITYGTFNIGEWFFNKINHYSSKALI